MKQISYKIKYLIVIIILLIIMSCSNGYDLSSPEKAYSSFIKAVEKKDIDGLSKCFDSEVELYSKENIKILANRLFNGVKIESYKFINNESISDTKNILIVEAVWKVKDNFKAKSTVRITFKQINGDWRIYSADSLTFNP